MTQHTTPSVGPSSRPSGSAALAGAAGTALPAVWGARLLDQLDQHWRGQLRPRLEGLTDAEYLWEPLPGCWNVRPRGTGQAPVQAGGGALVIDFALPEPVPPPLTTIAWRLAHLVVGVLGARVAGHFDGPPADYTSWHYAGTAHDALTQLDEGYAAWTTGVRSLAEDEWERPCGSVEGPWAEHTMGELVLHISREVIHHGAEIALLRDLHAHTADHHSTSHPTSHPTGHPAG